MSSPYIRIEIKDMGHSKDGEKLTMLGQIFGYENCNGIAVVLVEKDSKTDLAFLELNATKNGVDQIMNEEDVAALKELWVTTEIVDSVAEQLGLNNPVN